MNSATRLAGLDLYLRVKEENHVYVGDFFTEDGTFVDTFAMRKHEGFLDLEGFAAICEAYAYIVCDWPVTGKG